AFLNAAEDVDVEPETIEDLLDTLTTTEEDDALQNDVDATTKNDAQPAPQPVGRTILDITGDGDSDDDPDYIDYGPEEEVVDISSLYAMPALVPPEYPPWSSQEIRAMLHHLKERGMSAWIKEYVVTRNVPIVRLLDAFGISLCPELRAKRPTTLLFFLRVALSRELRMRERLSQYNTIDDAVQLIKGAQRIVILTGAGISVSCGIPDFRSSTGLYANLKERGEYELDDPQEMFDIHYFKQNPAVFYEIYPSNFVPSPCHRFIKLIEDRNKNYTQNIDTLETLAGVKHAILSKKVPVCAACCPPEVLAAKKKKLGKKKAQGKWDSQDEDESDAPAYPPGIMKPDIIFFGEKLTDDFDDALKADREQVDLLIIIGTMHLPHSVPQILINKTPVRHISPDIVLLGDADRVVEHLCSALGWSLPEPVTRTSGSTALSAPQPNLKKRPSSEMQELPPTRVGQSHVWLFEGAEGGRWVEYLRTSEMPAALQADSPSTTQPLASSKPDSGTDSPAKKPRVEY
ncbi:DHS-like NAD/FAD-binding domain-containing protein, partial [Schizophyllum amplum]